MSMYEEFQNQKGPAYVTAKHGIHPETSQKEFERFLVMSSRDPYDLQNKLTATISDAPLEIQSLINKSSQHVLLTNNEIMSIVTFKMRRLCRFSYPKPSVGYSLRSSSRTRQGNLHDLP